LFLFQEVVIYNSSPQETVTIVIKPTRPKDRMLQGFSMKISKGQYR